MLNEQYATVSLTEVVLTGQQTRPPTAFHTERTRQAVQSPTLDLHEP